MLHPLRPTPCHGPFSRRRWQSARRFSPPARSQPVACGSRDETHGCRYVKLQVLPMRCHSPSVTGQRREVVEADVSEELDDSGGRKIVGVIHPGWCSQADPKYARRRA
jgi:hypothetical protein